MPSSSLILSVGAILSTLSPTVFATKYSHPESFTASNWLDGFKFETYDLNQGFVNYVDEDTAKKSGLYKIDQGDVVFGVDSKEKLKVTDQGRKSVRLEGQNKYNKGLFVLDVKEMPGACGMWPAFWTLGQDPWPVNGEIDIIEGVNDNKVNKYVLHTDTDCKVEGKGMTAAPASLDCALNGANGPSGCDVNEVRTNSFGPGFKGGYYVMEWDSNVIQIWFFPRTSTVPRSLATNSPDTSEFGTPAAKFAGSACDIEKRFKDHRFIFTNNFCGDWAGNTYAQSGCPKQYELDGKTELSSQDSCRKYVAEHPEAFKDQNWRIGSFKTYKKNSVSSSSSVSVSKTSSIASSSTKVSSSASSTKVSSSSAHVSSSASSHVVSSSAHASSSASHVASSSVHASASSSASHVASVSSHVSSVHSASSDIHVSSASSVIHGSSSIAHASSTPATSVSSVVHQSSSVAHVSSQSIGYVSSNSEVHVSTTYYPTGQTSSAVYPVSSASVKQYGNFSAPVSYSVPAYDDSKSSAPVYGASSSVPVYGDAPKSTPCTTSSAKGASSTPGYPPVYPNSAPVYNDYPSYPVSSPVKNDYPYLPSFTPVSPIYPPTTSAPSYNDYNQPPVSKTTITTTYTTTYVDVCETGYITKTTTFAVTYCPTSTPAVPTPGKPNNPPTYGWDITTKVCQYGCGEGPKTVTVTVPCTKCDLSKATPTPGLPNKPNTPEKPNTPGKPNTPTCNGYDCKDDVTMTTKIYQTKVITLTKTPVPDTPKSSPPVYGDKPSSKPVEAPKVTPPVSKPNEPARSTPAVPVVSVPVVSGKPPNPPVYGNKNNGTVSISVGTGVHATPSKTGYSPPVFTGAAASVQAGGLAVLGGVVAAFFL